MDKKISQLDAVSSLDGTELVEVVQTGTNKKTTTQAIADLGGGGGGIGGGGTTNFIPKFTPDGTTLGDSAISDLAEGLFIDKTAADSQYINLLAKNTNDNIEVQLNLISNNTVTIYQANLYIVDSISTVSGGLVQDLSILKWGYDTSGVDDVKISLEKSTAIMLATGGSYNAGLLKIDFPHGIAQIGDFGNAINSTYITVDDVNQTIDLKSGILSVNGVAAVSGSFQDATGLTITVTNGIITSIV